MTGRWCRRLLLGALALGMTVCLGYAAPAPQSTGEEERLESPSPADEELIRQIERDSENVMSGGQFSYDPDGRRDPFEALVRTQNQTAKGKRPKGVAGMLVAEIDLKGVAIDPGGSPVALFRGSDNRGYTLRVGDIVYDGRVVSIDSSRGLVVFRQHVDDPRRIKPYRDVVKRLYPIEDDDDSLIGEEGA
ncbi:MAG: pilus assembly protein PilP [Acidobacteriota bacterium]|nr:pilus assembly protein PilP [Acidobacteriota bacterium]